MKPTKAFPAFATLLAAFALTFAFPTMVSAETEADGGATTTQPSTATDPGTSDIGDLGITSSDTETSDESFFEKVGNFVSDNATWFILGVIVLAAIVAGILILRARRKGTADNLAAPTAKPGVRPPAPGPRGTAAAAGAAAAAPSASEIKRRRRAAMQRAREEERLRRKSGGSPGAPGTAPPTDPVAAEKEAARRAATSQPPSVAASAPRPVSPAQEAVTEVNSPNIPNAPGSVGEAPIPDAPQPGVAAAAAGTAAAAGLAAATGADAEQRLREKVAEIKASQAPVPDGALESGQPPVSPSTPDQPVSPYQAGSPPPTEPTEGAAPAPVGQPSPVGEERPAFKVPADLAEAESRIRTSREARDRTLSEAEERLHLLEERAAAAERRAAFAEQLVELKVEEGEHERRLQEVVDRINRAEERARQAEIRAESAERAASEALRGVAQPVEVPAQPFEPPPTPNPGIAPADQVLAGEVPSQPGPISVVNVNTATFEELRGADLSVTQATRVLAYRERFGGYGSIDDLVRVPGFTEELVAGLRSRLEA